MAGCDIHSVYVGVAGSHISSMNSDGVVAIKEREVMPSDIDRVIDSARARAISEGQRVLHVLPQEYAIDAQGGIREPLGMSGVRLEARVRSEEHTSELQSRPHLVCRLLLEKKKKKKKQRES